MNYPFCPLYFSCLSLLKFRSFRICKYHFSYLHISMSFPEIKYNGNYILLFEINNLESIKLFKRSYSITFVHYALSYRFFFFLFVGKEVGWKFFLIYNLYMTLSEYCSWPIWVVKLNSFVMSYPNLLILLKTE